MARDNSRLHMTNRVRQDILRAEIAIKEIEADETTLSKNIAILEFKLSQINAADPEKDDKTKCTNASIEMDKKCLEDCIKEKEGVNKKIEQYKADIEAIQNGDKKVSTETLQELSSQYLDALTNHLLLVKVADFQTV